MAGDLNRATLIGRLGKDPTIKTMNSGDKVANFSLATSESWTKNGEKVEKTQWHNCVVWGKLADIVEKYVHKGDKLLIEGAIETRKYEQNGVEKYTTEIVLRGFDSKLLLLGSKQDGGTRQDTGGGGASAPATNIADDPDMDIPFVSPWPDARGL